MRYESDFRNSVLRAVIIDDEPDCVSILQKMLAKYCPTVMVVAAVTDSEEGIVAIKSFRPELVFLDIEMPFKNGFQVLDEVGNLNFHLVFTTAYDKYAVKAIKFSALDYLLKPIDFQELISSVEKAEQKYQTEKQQIELLRQQLYSSSKKMQDKMALPSQHGYTFIHIPNILYCEADDCYTRIFLEGNETFLVSKTLGDIEELLEMHPFFRTHRQYLVNLRQIKNYVRGDGAYIVMNNLKQIPIARNRKDEFNHILLKNH